MLWGDVATVLRAKGSQLEISNEAFKLPDFIKSFIDYTLPYESPMSFWKWAAYGAVSAALRDNCWRKFGDITICPNIFILLLAPSAEHRKGNPVKLCEQFVSRLKSTKVISGRSSIQAILDELARGETDSETGRIIGGGSALFSAPELSAGLVNDPEAIKILTDIYDYREEYTSRLRGTGQFKIKNVCFTMLAASNEDLLRDVYDTKAIFGGLLGRTFLIKPNEFRPANSLFNVNHSQDLQSLQDHLVRISKLHGQFEFTNDAQREYESWYEPFRDSYRAKPDRSGVSGRIHTGVIKLAMILCANETLGIEIKRCHIEEAISECMSILGNYKEFVMAGGRSSLSEVGSMVLTICYNSENHVMSRKKLLAQNWHNFDSETLDKVIITFEQAGFVHTLVDDNEISYKLTEKCLETLFQGEVKK